METNKKYTAPPTATHYYRGYTITKHDTGARRMGRDITYRVSDTEGHVIHIDITFAGAKARLDWLLDATAEDIAKRDALIASLTGDK